MTLSLPSPGQESTGTLTDGAGHELPYVIRLAPDPTNARTLVILHGRGANTRAARFVDPNWNIICPLDRYGERNCGSWWLGENGDFFVAAMLHELVRSFREALGTDQGLYMWGSSMGGYGAILHGTLLRARAIYAHIPQIRLRGTDYTDGRNKPVYDAVLGDRVNHRFADLARFVAARPRKGLPLYFLSQNRFDYKGYLQQHCFHFVQACQKADLAYGLRIDPIDGHVLYRKIAETVTLFDEFAPQIDQWRRRSAETPSKRQATAVVEEE